MLAWARAGDDDDEAARKYADMKAKMPDIAAGYVACAQDGLFEVAALHPLVRLP